MMFFSNKRWSYQSLSQTGDEAEAPTHHIVELAKSKYQRRQCRLVVALLFAVAIAILAFFYGKEVGHLAAEKLHLLPRCSNPARRREWRTLHPAEQQEYVDAVRCLGHLESSFEPESTRYDDFVFAHLFEGTEVHNAAGFLPWHRYFIHRFETALREECGFRGTLPYWDWTLDSDDLTASPVWNTTSGFGGNGDFEHDGPELFEGRCVMDGPFANTTRHWVAMPTKGGGKHGHSHSFDVLPSPHCLARGFQSGDAKRKLEAKITPAALEEILMLDDYVHFFNALESKSHNSIPQVIRGDFYLGTAPNDPLFYLHHGQVDRLWWIWQQRDAVVREHEYQGQRGNSMEYDDADNADASKEDIINLGIVGDPVLVRELLTTKSSMLCYTY